jgi:hypothetical protein
LNNKLSNIIIYDNKYFGNILSSRYSMVVNKNLITQQEYLGSSGISNLGTRLPQIPSNQRVAKDN